MFPLERNEMKISKPNFKGRKAAEWQEQGSESQKAICVMANHGHGVLL